MALSCLDDENSQKHRAKFQSVPMHLIVSHVKGMQDMSVAATAGARMSAAIGEGMRSETRAFIRREGEWHARTRG
jgi:hypothetical protein